jgi:hypothetical protein
MNEDEDMRYYTETRKDMNMPSIDDVFGGDNLKSEHLKGKAPPVVTIKSVEVKEFTDKEKGKTERKLSVSFLGTKRVLVCNQINANMIASIAGTREYDQWPGTKIKLVVEKVQFGPNVVDGIRVKDPGDKIETGPQPKKPALADDMDDAIPF